MSPDESRWTAAGTQVLPVERRFNGCCRLNTHINIVWLYSSFLQQWFQPSRCTRGKRGMHFRVVQHAYFYPDVLPALICHHPHAQSSNQTWIGVYYWPKLCQYKSSVPKDRKDTKVPNGHIIFMVYMYKPNALFSVCAYVTDVHMYAFARRILANLSTMT